MHGGGIAVNLPSYITSLNVVQLEKSALNVHLPEKSLVLEAETQLTAAGGTYPIPPFYDDFYGTQPRLPTTRNWICRPAGSATTRSACAPDRVAITSLRA